MYINQVDHKIIRTYYKGLEIRVVVIKNIPVVGVRVVGTGSCELSKNAHNIVIDYLIQNLKNRSCRIKMLHSKKYFNRMS